MRFSLSTVEDFLTLIRGGYLEQTSSNAIIAIAKQTNET